jgi:hypothetical protein
VEAVPRVLPGDARGRAAAARVPGRRRSSGRQRPLVGGRSVLRLGGLRAPDRGRVGEGCTRHGRQALPLGRRFRSLEALQLPRRVVSPRRLEDRPRLQPPHARSGALGRLAVHVTRRRLPRGRVPLRGARHGGERPPVVRGPLRQARLREAGAGSTPPGPATRATGARTARTDAGTSSASASSSVRGR